MALRITGPVIAKDAARYIGQGYVYGGNASRVGDWDCASFVSYVLGHDLRLALPGGRWGGPNMPPADHGPVVTDYASWNGATTVGIPQAGDLCCWVGVGTQGHIGIAVSGSEMVSALNPQLGVQRTAIVGTGPAQSPLIYRRVAGIRAGAALITAPAGGAARPPVAALLLAVLAPLIVVGAVAAGATVLLVGGAWVVKALAQT